MNDFHLGIIKTAFNYFRTDHDHDVCLNVIDESDPRLHLTLQPSFTCQQRESKLVVFLICQSLSGSSNEAYGTMGRKIIPKSSNQIKVYVSASFHSHKIQTGKRKPRMSKVLLELPMTKVLLSRVNQMPKKASCPTTV